MAGGNEAGGLGKTKLVPEFYVTDFRRSLAFYTEILGFSVAYDRPEQRFAYLDLGGAELMIEQTVDPQRMFIDGALDYPLGRGMHLQIEVGDVDALYARVQVSDAPIPRAMEERWYRRDAVELGNRQFWVRDPDGYNLRFFQDLGQRPIKEPAR